MEATLGGVQEDALLGPLSLSLADSPGASYIVQRRDSTTHSAIPSCSYAGVNVLRISLSSSTEWADLANGYLSYTIQNEANAPLQFIGQPHVSFSRLRILAGGQEIEDIQDYNRLCEMLQNFQSSETRLNASYHGLPTQMAMVQADATHADNPNLWRSEDHQPMAISNNGSARVCVQFPLSAILGSANKKWMPLYAINGGLEILLTLANPTTHLKTGLNSSAYRLTDIAYNCPMYTLDSALQEKYFQSLAKGDALLIHSQQFSHNEIFLTPSQGSFAVSLNKPVSRLATVFISFVRELSAADIQGGQTYVNTFDMFSDAAQTIEHQLQIGSKNYPEMPVRGVSESWLRLMQALGVSQSLAHSLGVSYYDYISKSFVLAYDTEKVSLAHATGVSTQGGQELRLSVKNLQPNDGSVQMKRAYIATHQDVIFEIRAGSVTKLD